MKRAMVAVLGLCVMFTVTYAQDEKKPEEKATDPVEILKKVDAAARAVKAVKYTAKVEGTGAAQATAAVAQGTCVLSGGWNNSSMSPKKFRCEVKYKSRPKSSWRNVTIGTDGEQFYLIDHKNQKAHVGSNFSIWGRHRRGATAVLTGEFMHPTPFNDEINGDTQELKGSKMVGDEDCYEVRVVYASAAGEAIWCVSKKDFLPRSRHDLLRSPSSGERSGQLRIMMDLVIDPPLSEGEFKLRLPDGYEQTDMQAR